MEGDVARLNFRDLGRRLDVGFAFGKAVQWSVVTISTLVLGLAFVLLFPRAADALLVAGDDRTGASIGWGIALFIGLPILAALLLVTIVGLPLGIGLLLALFPIYSLAYTATAWFVGRKILSPPRARALALVAGVLILRIVALIPIVAGLAWLVAVVFGLGLMAVAARAGGAREAPPTPAMASA